MRPETCRNWIFSLFICLLLLCLTEAGGRIAYRVLYGTWSTPFAYDAELGWIVRPFYRSHHTAFDEAGKRRSITFETFDHGFRQWGDPQSRKKKIFFIGDSFTYAYDVSNEKTYYEVFRKDLGADVEVFAYGAGGYGTLQEFIIISRFVDIINPDIIVLQFCNNDFENNSLAAEQKSIALSQTIRPYLHNNKIMHRYSKYNPYALLLHNTLAFAFLDSRIQIARFGLNKGYVTQQPSADEHRKNVEFTRTILHMIRQRVSPSTTLAVFNANSAVEGNMQADLEDIAQDSGFVMIPDIAARVFEAQKKGLPVRAPDGGHWSDLGHEMIGKDLARYFAERFGKDQGKSSH